MTNPIRTFKHYNSKKNPNLEFLFGRTFLSNYDELDEEYLNNPKKFYRNRKELQRFEIKNVERVLRKKADKKREIREKIRKKRDEKKLLSSDKEMKKTVDE